MTVYPCAKINLGLNVVSRREDGYHDLETIFYPVAIHDEMDVCISTEHDGCRLTVQGVDNLCAPEKNLVVKAYNLLKEEYELPGVDVTLNKLLPSQAGMGGGSSDGAYMITALNDLCQLNLTTEQMQQFAARLGADCPFFIEARAAYAEGIGEKLHPLDEKALKEKLAGMCIVLIKPDVAVSTGEAYAGVKPAKTVVSCMEVVTDMPLEKWKDHLRNDFEDSIFPKLPVLKEVKESLYANGARYAAMSGSGSTLYGLFHEKNDKDKIEKIKSIYANKYYFKVVKV